MKLLFGITHAILYPLVLIARWNIGGFVFNTLLFIWLIAGAAYLVLVERD